MQNAVIFDMDGVIIDSEPIHKELDNQTLKSLGINMTDEEYFTYAGCASPKMWSMIKTRHSIKNTVEELVKIERVNYLNYLNSTSDFIKPINGVVKLIEELFRNGFKLAVASSSPSDVIEIIMSTMNIKMYFNELVSGDSVNTSKPDPGIFLSAAERLAVKPQCCIVIEDSCNGVKAANRAGMKCIGFKNPHSGAQDLTSADAIISSFSEINMELLTRLLK